MSEKVHLCWHGKEIDFLSRGSCNICLVFLALSLLRDSATVKGRYDVYSCYLVLLAISLIRLMYNRGLVAGLMNAQHM